VRVTCPEGVNLLPRGYATEMRNFMLTLLTAIALAIAPTAASAQATGQQIPVPGPILTKLGHTPMVELWDGGGGLPYLGSSTSYNAGDWESNLRAYATDDPKVSGPSVYEQQIAKVDAVAAKWLSHSGGRYKLAHRGAHKRGVKLARVSHKRHGHKHGKRAIVFDVDETALSNYSAIDADNFTYGDNSKAEATNEIGKAIPPTLALYKLAQKKGIATFFITGRGESVRDHTAHNLQREGFTNYDGLVLKPAGFTGTTVDYKAGARKAIEGQGYRIVASVGDQYSDLAGGHEAAAFKLPNPFYFLP
jgi:predicted secreted acid phosphatase